MVQSIPRSRFIHTALHERAENFSAGVLDENGIYKVILYYKHLNWSWKIFIWLIKFKGEMIQYRAFYEVLIQQSNGHTIDFMVNNSSLLKKIKNKIIDNWYRRRRVFSLENHT